MEPEPRFASEKSLNDRSPEVSLTPKSGSERGFWQEGSGWSPQRELGKVRAVCLLTQQVEVSRDKLSGCWESLQGLGGSGRAWPPSGGSPLPTKGPARVRVSEGHPRAFPEPPMCEGLEGTSPQDEEWVMPLGIQLPGTGPGFEPRLLLGL